VERGDVSREGGEMKDDDENEDMLFSVLFVAVTIATVLFSVAGVGLIIWSFI
jgi:hypothetical protein